MIRTSQGEANADQRIKGVDQTNYYAAMYQGMIADWRERKAMGDFAFMTVQLPPSVDSVAPLGPKQNTGRVQIRLAEAQAGHQARALGAIARVAAGERCRGAVRERAKHPRLPKTISQTCQPN